MTSFNVQSYMTLEMYLRRPKLTEESTSLLRIRAALKCADRLYAKCQYRVDDATFPHYGITLLNRLKNGGSPHPLDEELRDVFAAWRRKESPAEVYWRHQRYVAKRIIGTVRYGGRRG